MNNDKAYWLALAESYFNCTATDEEEQRLKTFVATTDYPEFDDVRAVMGYTATARRVAAHPPASGAMLGTPRPESNRSGSLRRRLVAAAAALLLVGGATTVYRLSRPDCVAYVHGERITDRQYVMKLMHATISLAARDATGESTMESQLADMFDTVGDAPEP